MLSACGGGSDSTGASTNSGSSTPPVTNPPPVTPTPGPTTASPDVVLVAANIHAGDQTITGLAARFNNPVDVAADSHGNVYVADNYNNAIRKITPSGFVTTIGHTSNNGGLDSTGVEARFNSPSSIAVDSKDNIYVADTNNVIIRKITPSGVISTIAGKAYTPGSADGTGSDARFNQPVGITVDKNGNIYVSDAGNENIRKITADGVVTTLAGSVSTSAIAIDGIGTAAHFRSPKGIAVDDNGYIYVADMMSSTIRKITPSGVVTTLAGTSNVFAYADGTGAAAKFDYPQDVAVDKNGNVLVADNGTIRKITPAGVVTTLAGQFGVRGHEDGIGAAAHFYGPTGVTVDSTGNVYVADSNNNLIRKITPAAAVTTIAGMVDQYGSYGNSAGNPTGAAVDTDGNTYIADCFNNTIRKITSTGVVSILAGIAGKRGSTDGDGSTALFYYPTGVAVDSAGNVYVADSGNNTIRKITSSGAVTTLAGTAGKQGNFDSTGAAAQFYNPHGIAVDQSSNVYVADTSNSSIRKISPTGVVTTIAGMIGNLGMAGSTDGFGFNAEFFQPTGIAVDKSGNVYVADSENSTIRKISGNQVTTFAGTAGIQGALDGTGSTAQFYYPTGISTDSSGNVYVADAGNNTIRKITPSGIVTTVVNSSNALGVKLKSLTNAELQPTGIAVSPKGQLIITNNSALLAVTGF
ncbi:hypothetical protein [Aquirhabdus sp.]|uniref:NHL domain-containing protein n=1 Tax=Aquirhabdus sp. TaxID=2824160 RepID=UPI00396C8745